MKQLFVLAADSDAEGLLTKLLARPKALGIRPIEFTVERFVGRDAGIVNDGPEIIRSRNLKHAYEHVILIWDRDGSGWERKMPEDSLVEVQRRLDSVTWQGRSGCTVLVPELEEWLWQCPSAVAKVAGVTQERLDAEVTAATARLSPKLGVRADEVMAKRPKELFQDIFYRMKRKRPLPEDFEVFGSSVRVDELKRSESFARLHHLVQERFGR